jgi:hypothetical protein
MRRIPWSVVLLLSLAALGAGCGKRPDPGSQMIAPPTAEPKSLHQQMPTPPLPNQ